MKIPGNLKKVIAAVAGAFVGALLTWVIMNWIPNVTILAGAALAGYIAYTKVKV
jgi:uncharacterized protein (DUF697 family)